jgi:hypothetical protein
MYAVKCSCQFRSLAGSLARENLCGNIGLKCLGSIVATCLRLCIYDYVVMQLSSAALVLIMNV